MDAREVEEKWRAWEELVERVQTQGCIAITIGSLKKACQSPQIRGARGKFPAGMMEEWLKHKRIALGNDVAGYARSDRLVLLYDARKDSDIAKLFETVDAVQKMKVPSSRVQEYARQLSSACLAMAH